MKFIGLCGYKRSGKDTVASMLRKLGYVQLAFATPIKAMLETLLAYAHVSEKIIFDCLNGDMKEFKLETLQNESCRYAMQTLGSEWGRNLIGQDLWVDMLFNNAIGYDKVVISDVRYDNEVVALHKHGGKLILINRGLGPDSHTSESIEHIKPDFTIGNWGTLDMLETTVKEVEELLWKQSS